MIKRYGNLFKQQTANLGQFYELVPIHRREICPGETVKSISGTVKFSSAMMRRYIESPALIQIYAFYCPHRLVWDQWREFISGDNGLTNVPTATAWPLLFERNSTRPVLGRRAYKLIFNEFFGQEGQSWYADITDDANMEVNTVKIWDQYLSKLTLGEVTSDVFLADHTTDVPAQTAIPLEEFARAMRDSRSKNRASISGDKYVDLMRTMGVDLDWRVQNAPEFLGSMTKKIAPFTIDSSESASLQDRNSRFRGALNINMVKRKAFAEHGTIWLLACMRPAAHSETHAPDSNLTTRDRYYMGDNMNVYEGGTDSGYKNARFEHYRSGRSVFGNEESVNTMPWLTNTAGQELENIYPDPGQWLTQGDMGSYQFSVTADLTTSHLTPVPPNRV